ncbi:MAG: septal ring lytic transglycosylase RlpA family protein [Salinisphaera sp.]|nr:septal ring lytic transglycosylase RlpA family protein [Salinisphaera sp.]
MKRQHALTRILPCLTYAAAGAAMIGLIVLSGCASHPAGSGASHGGGYYQNDGPPKDQNIDLSKIPDAVPRNVPHSPYGNPTSYTALGHTYDVLKSAAGFTQTGRASWYGRQFNGERTSSGEPYSMFRMTAAHKRLPLPTWVRVTNLDNGKHCIVKVNDRGPFHDGRIIDLSYVAARRLGIVSNGSAPVRIETVTPATMDQAPKSPAVPRAPLRSAQNPDDEQTAPSSTAGAGHRPGHTDSAGGSLASATPRAKTDERLYLQAGAFGNPDNARRQVQRLSRAGANHVTIVPPDPSTPLYRVHIGPFATASQRSRTGRQLAANGFSVRDQPR